MAELNNWIQVQVSIQVESPMLLGEQRSYGTYTPSRQRVPGSALRGALAMSLGPDSADFRTLFLDGEEPLFGDCWPAPDPSTLSVPVPVTAYTCKEYPGFKPPPGDMRRGPPPHGAFDTLVRTLVYDEVLKARLPLPLIYEPHCQEQECRKPAMLASAPAMYRGDIDWHASEIRVSRSSRTAIGRRRGVAEDEMLFTLESIRPGMVFTGIVRLPKKKANLLLNALPNVTRLGTARSRGMGRVTVSGSRRVVRWASGDADVLKRLQRFNDASQQERDYYYKVLTDQPVSDGGWYLPLLLLSDACLTQAGAPSLIIAPADMGLPASEVSFVRAFTRGKVIGGWHQAAGLPRRTRVAARAGSVFVFRVGDLAFDDPTVRTALERLEMYGLGEDRERGRGQVAVCMPFHYEEVG